MKIIRSTKCSLKYLTNRKKIKLNEILFEYGKVVNTFIDYFWGTDCIPKYKLLKPIIDIPDTWLSARLRKEAAREALDMIKSVKEVLKSNKEQLGLTIKAIESKIKRIPPDSKLNRRKINNLYCKLKKLNNKLSMKQATKPRHQGNRMCVSSAVTELQDSKNSNFDAWLHLHSIGNKIIVDLPIKFHKHYNDLEVKGERLNSYIITKDYVQLCFKIDTGPKKEVKSLIGIDTGINSLASLNTGNSLGQILKNVLTELKGASQVVKADIEQSLH